MKGNDAWWSGGSDRAIVAMMDGNQRNNDRRMLDA